MLSRTVKDYEIYYTSCRPSYQTTLLGLVSDLMEENERRLWVVNLFR